jgi:pimeloyl-ACP methyl ester carboxylesterase
MTAPSPKAERRMFTEEMPKTKLIGVPVAGHSPMENDPGEVAAASMITVRC